jgi:hypothetical protein
MRNVDDLIFNEKLFWHFWKMDPGVVKVTVQSNSMRSPPCWKGSLNESGQNICHEIRGIKFLLGRYQIHHLKIINTSHQCQYKLHRVNLLSHFLRQVISGYTSLSRMLEFKGEPALVPCHEIGEIIPFHIL